MNRRILSRLEKVEQGTVKRKMTAIPVYLCEVDGKREKMRALDIAYAEQKEGRTVTVIRQCGFDYEPEATPGEYTENVRLLDRFMQEMQDEYNSPEAAAQRQAEYEEICRIGELRRQDCELGRNMDECHPLPWQRRKE